jgi:hypothetical protein
MGEYLIVDGYNVIFAWPELEELKKTSMENARLKLIDILISHAALTGFRIIVVFDAHRVKDVQQRVENEHGLKVIYTAEGETADTLIERLAGEFSRRSTCALHADRDTVYVATSDWAEQRMIFGQGAYRITPKELLRWVERVEREPKYHYIGGTAADDYLENRLKENIRAVLEKWRRKKS